MRTDASCTSKFLPVSWARLKTDYHSLSYIANLDPAYIYALFQRASFLQVSVLRYAIWKHIAFQTSIRVKIPVSTECLIKLLESIFFSPIIRLQCVLGQVISNLPIGITSSLFRLEARQSSERIEMRTAKSMDRSVVPTTRSSPVSRSEIRHASIAHFTCPVRA